MQAYYFYTMHRKALPRYHDGVKFLNWRDLPAPQASLFKNWKNREVAFSFPSDLIQGLELIPYEDYDFWFEYHYLPEKDLDEMI